MSLKYLFAACLLTALTSACTVSKSKPSTKPSGSSSSSAVTRFTISGPSNAVAYVEQYKKIAVSESVRTGIPASIKMAQALLESNAGRSRLSTKNNNHFGIKCFSKNCKKGHCANFNDDHHKDFFRKYKSSWESYRAHSKLLMGKRYRHLKELGNEDYRNWAKGLKKAGYATDKRYAEKLINIIDELKLHQFDNE